MSEHHPEGSSSDGKHAQSSPEATATFLSREYYLESGTLLMTNSISEYAGG